MFEGFPVVRLDIELLKKCDYVVICSKYWNEILEELNGRFPEYKNIVERDAFLEDIFIKNCQGQIKNNDLYDYFVNKPHRVIYKWLHYFRLYDRYLSQFRGKNITFCEVGVFRGGSLQMWKDYFGDNATIIGIDIDEKCKEYEEENIHVEIGSQSDPEFWEYIKKKYPKIDVLLDDGGHTMEMQITTFKCMFSHISDGGIYMCEDLHTSYYDSYGGGYRGDTFIEFCKSLIDDIHAIYCENDELSVSYNTKNIMGLHFHDSMVVIEKELRKAFPVTVMRGTL